MLSLKIIPRLIKDIYMYFDNILLKRACYCEQTIVDHILAPTNARLGGTILCCSL